jgi:hypothetical protein
LRCSDIIIIWPHNRKLESTRIRREMRIPVDIAVNLDIHESVLEEFHQVLLKVRDASSDRENKDSFWNQMIQQVEYKLEYIRSRPQYIEENKALQEDHREQVKKEFEELQRQQRLKAEELKRMTENHTK